MPEFRRKISTETVKAEQFDGKTINGVCFQPCSGFGDRSPHVHTIHDGQKCEVVIGDWILPEPDGEHFYPVKPDIFADRYESIDVAMNDAKYELLCQMCDRQHPVWSVTNEIWNSVVHEGEHFLCPTCFINLAELRGLVTRGIWRMRLETGKPADEVVVDIVLLCPQCGQPHVDAPEPDVCQTCGYSKDTHEQEDFKQNAQCVRFVEWLNPPHKSHLCAYCKTIWRPSDSFTNGIAAPTTRGKADTWQS